MGNRNSSRPGARTASTSLAILVAAGCTSHHRGNTLSAKEGQGADVSHEATLATVLAIDGENRVLIMKEADGDSCDRGGR